MDTDKVERDFTRAYMEKLTDRIAELEAFNQEQGQLMSAMTEYYEDDKGVAFQSHNLEQQAKGLIDYAEALYMNIKRGKYHQLMMAAGRLQIEAKALKEG
jgi:hypothetical protein